MVYRGSEGAIFDAPNRGNPLANDSYALNKKDTLHPARLIDGMARRSVQLAGLELCDTACTKYQFFHL